MPRNAIETVIGAVVLAVAGGFLAFAYTTSDIHAGKGGGYHVSADFTNAVGVSKGGDVRVSGVKVGVIDDYSLDPKNYHADITMAIDPSVKLPTDSAASITSEGLLGGKFIAIQPGADTTMMKEGDKIAYTQPSVSLEELIGKFVFSSGGVDKGGDAAAKPAEAAGAKPVADLPMP